MPESTRECDDPIMEEVRRNRAALSARFEGDTRKLVEFLNQQASKSGRKVISLPPRRPSAAPPAA